MQRYNEDEIEQIFLDDERPSAQEKSSQIKPIQAVENAQEYKKLRNVFIVILSVALLLSFVRGLSIERFLADFLAVFLIAFAGLKFVEIEYFAHAYRSFDLIASRLRPWGYTVPFIEAFLGFWYLLSEAPQKLNILALVFAGSALVGTLIGSRHKSRVKSATTKNLIRLPLMKVSFIENTIIFFIALLLLILKV